MVVIPVQQSISRAFTILQLFRTILHSLFNVTCPQLSQFLFSFRELLLSFKIHVELLQLELSSIVLISSVQ